MVIDGRIPAQPGELAHWRLAALGCRDVGRHPPRQLHRNQRIGVNVGLDAGVPCLLFLNQRLGRFRVGLDLGLGIGRCLPGVDCRLLAAADQHRQQQGKAKGPANRFRVHASLP